MLTTKLFTYKYIPARNPPPEEKVLVIFHGLGDSLHGFTWMPPQLGIDSLSYLLVNAPDDYFGGFSWFDFTGGGTNMGPAIGGIIRSRNLIQGLIKELMDQKIASENIILFGFSQGCLMALDAGLRSEVLLGGICGVSGWLAFQEEYPAKFSALAKSQKFLITHGFQDPLLPYALTKAQSQFLIKEGIDLNFKSYDKDHTILPEELMEIKAWLLERSLDKIL